MIPYNGEEVKLYWANHDQYYIKSAEHFQKYSFKVPYLPGTLVVNFKLTEAETEQGNVKPDENKYCVLAEKEPELTGEDLNIYFEYRALNEKEKKELGAQNKQDKLDEQAAQALEKKYKDNHITHKLWERIEDQSLLLQHVHRYTRENKYDFFIHKNLKRFLSEQLDYFIKAEVISLETLEKERFFDKHITRAKVVREIGEKIIDFLSQIEDFQKKLWEKKKFVLKTEYVITTDLVPEELYPEILKNKAQANEWKELGFEVAKSKPKLKDMKLPIDTKHFPEEFKEKLLERITESADLDDLLDGLLIKSENWQALLYISGEQG